MDPAPRIQGNPNSHNKLLSLSNGSLKKHQHHPYMECMKNHAASLGGHSLDGCGEYMPSPSSSLLCAACGCHRNFHRHLLVSQHDLHDDDDDEDGGKERSSSSPPPAHMLLALRHSRPTSAAMPRKRFRNKFSREQKERMVALSERLGWRMQKRDEVLIEESCKEIGVNRGVFKVWMHNNKRAFCVGSRKEEPRSEGGDGGGNGNVGNGSPSS